VTADVNDAEIPRLIRKGISGVFMKHGSPALLIQGIRETMDGKALFGQDLLRRALEKSQSPRTDPHHSKLTERERRVLSFVFEGLANKQIADRLQISETAVRASLQQLFTQNWRQNTKPVSTCGTRAIPRPALVRCSVAPLLVAIYLGCVYASNLAGKVRCASSSSRSSIRR